VNYKVYASLNEDIDTGRCWISTPKVPTRSIISMKSESGKRTYCEAMQIESNFLNHYNVKATTKKIDLDTEPNVIVMSEWYRHRLGDLETQQEYEIEIASKDNYWAKFRACCHHPQIVVRLTTWLALLAIILGVIGVVLGSDRVSREAEDRDRMDSDPVATAPGTDP